MCKDCGCSITDTQVSDKMEHIHANPQLNDTKTVDVIKKILDKNDHEAGHNREHLKKIIY